MCDINKFRQTCVLPPGPTVGQMTTYMADVLPNDGQEILIPGQNTNVNDPNLDNQAGIWRYCSQNDSAFGGVCREGLISACQNYTKADTSNRYVRQLCGCYLPDSEYDPNVGRICDSACVPEDTIKYFETDDSLPSRCSSGVCVIDQVTLQLTGSNTGDINFYQACPSCGPSSCRCVINDVNVLVSNSKVGSLNIQQNCSGGSVCYAQGEGNDKVEVDCAPYFKAFGLTSSSLEQQQQRSQNVFLISFITAIILFIILITGILIGSYRRRKIIVNRIDVSQPKYQGGMD